MKKLGLGLLALTVSLVIATALYFARARMPLKVAEESVTHSTVASEVISVQASVSNPTSPEKPVSENRADLERLARTIHTESLPQEERRNALYEITQLGAKALPALTSIATAPLPEAVSQDPHSVDQLKHSFEIGLRVTALEALDELSNDPQLSPAVASSMLEILKVQKHRSLTLLAQISLSGIESGRPGKVKRAIDTLLKEKE